MEDNINMDLQEVGGGCGTGWSWLRIGTGSAKYEYGKEPSGSIKMWGISWLAAKTG
jgi:hypothetical protein